MGTAVHGKLCALHNSAGECNIQCRHTGAAADGPTMAQVKGIYSSVYCQEII